MRIGGTYKPDKNKKVPEVSVKNNLFPRSDLFVPVRANKTHEPSTKVVEGQQGLSSSYRLSSSSGLTRPSTVSSLGTAMDNPLLSCSRSLYGHQPYRENCNSRVVTGQPSNGNGVNSSSQSFNVLNSYYGAPLYDVKLEHLKRLGFAFSDKINLKYNPRGATKRERCSVVSDSPSTSPLTCGDTVTNLIVGSGLDEDSTLQGNFSPSGNRLVSFPADTLQRPRATKRDTSAAPESNRKLGSPNGGSTPTSRPGSPARQGSPKIAPRPKSPLQKELTRKSFVSNYVSLIDEETGEHHIMREPWSKPQSPLIKHLSNMQLQHHFAHSGGPDDNHHE